MQNQKWGKTMDVVEMPLREILQDFFFSFSSVSDFTALQRSVLASGIRTPLDVHPHEGGYRLLSGFKRYRVARNLELDHIPVTITPDTVPLEETFRHVLAEHLVTRQMNLVEKARVLSILEKLSVPWPKVKTDFLPLLELPAQRNRVEEVQSLLAFSQSVQQYIEKYDLPLRQTGMFRGLSLFQQNLVVDMANCLLIRGVELAEILVWLKDISMREGISLENVFESLGIVSISTNSEISRHEKIAQIKERIQNRKYPRITQWNQDLQKLKEEMGLPPDIRLSWDRLLESPGIRLEIQIRSCRDLQEMAAYFSQKKIQKKFGEMLKVV